MAKTRKKGVRTPVKGRKSNSTIVKKSPAIARKCVVSRSKIQKNLNKVLMYESPLIHLHHNGKQTDAYRNVKNTKESEDSSEHSQNERIMDSITKTHVVNQTQKEMHSLQRGFSEAERDATNSDDVSVPTKTKKLNKSPLSQINELDMLASTGLVEKIDESVICVDDLETSPVNNSSNKPQVNGEDVIVIDCNSSLTFSESCVQLVDQNAKLSSHLTDSIIVLDDESPTSINEIPSRPTDDCMVVWSSLPVLATSSNQSDKNSNVLKFDKILLDTSGDSTNLNLLKNDNSNKKLEKKSLKVTKFGVKKLSTKKLSEITKGLAKTAIVTKTKPILTKTPTKKKANGELIFSAHHSESKDQQASKDTKPKRGTLREIVIDGSNVAMAYTNNKLFSEKGIKMLIDYFSKKGHTVKVFVPQYRRAKHYPLLEKWYKQGIVVFTPSRKLGNKYITSYDDRYILEYATACKGIVVSQDQFRDLYAEKVEYRETIEKRLLIPTFVGDYVMFPEDPLGRNGPSLAEFLKH